MIGEGGLSGGGLGAYRGIDWGRYGAAPMMLLAAVALVDSIDRGILSGALTPVKDALHFSDFELGTLASASVVATLMLTVPGGYLSDRRRRTWIIAAVLAGWAVVSGVTALVRNYVEFLGVRAALGMGDAVNSPAARSLMADYYPPDRRARAYAVQSVSPVLGSALGTGLGGAVAGTLGWRWAFLIIGVPGSLLALRIRRMPEPARGASDRLVTGGAPLGPSTSAAPPVTPAEARPEKAIRSAPGEMARDVRAVLRIRTLVALVIGLGIAAGSLAGIGFWAPSYYQRVSGLSTAQSAGVAALLILVGAIGGTLLGGVVVDRLRRRVKAAAMLWAAVSQASGALFLFISLLPVPVLFVRVPLQVIAVLFLVAGIPGLAAMTSEILPAARRAMGFSVTTILSGVLSAITPPLVGAIADSFPVMVHHKAVGNLTIAFMATLPLVLVGSFVVFFGRRYAEADMAAAASGEPRT